MIKELYESLVELKEHDVLNIAQEQLDSGADDAVKDAIEGLEQFKRWFPL